MPVKLYTYLALGINNRTQAMAPDPPRAGLVITIPAIITIMVPITDSIAILVAIITTVNRGARLEGCIAASESLGASALLFTHRMKTGWLQSGRNVPLRAQPDG